MLRRIFFAVPDDLHARRVIDELQAGGIDREQMHAWSKSGAQLTGLPVATEAQGQDRVWGLDKLLWYADLISLPWQHSDTWLRWSMAPLVGYSPRLRY